MLTIQNLTKYYSIKTFEKQDKQMADIDYP